MASTTHRARQVGRFPTSWCSMRRPPSLGRCLRRLPSSKSVDVTFVCPHCSRGHASPDGRTRTVRCTCGQTLVVGSTAGGSPPGASRAVTSTAVGAALDGFPADRRRVSASAPGGGGPPPLPGRARSLPASAYDPVAARHGLLIDERQARALAAPRPVLVPSIEDADAEAVHVAPTSSGPAQPAAGQDQARRKDAPRPPASRPSRFVVVAAAILAFLIAGGGSAWFLVPRASGSLPSAVAEVLSFWRGLTGRGPGPADVASALQASAKPFHACLQAAERGPRRLRLEGRQVVLHVTVASSGRVTAPRLDQADLDESSLGACLKSAARRMAFPPHSGEPVEVRIPLQLDGAG